MTRAILVFCCHSDGGSGSVTRALSLAEALSEQFHVTVLLDGSYSRATRIPVEVDLLILPANDAEKRRALMLEKVEQLAPRIILIEDFPFAGQRAKEEILPLIQKVRGNTGEESLVISVTNGILTNDHPDEQGHSDIAANYLQRYFDMVLVQSDPVFARLEEFFQPNSTLATPMFHAGFVSPASYDDRPARKTAGGIVVSAGDGHEGGPLFRAAIEAHRILWHTLQLPMTIVAGKRLPEDEWQELLALSDTSQALTLIRPVADLRSEIANAQLSVGQCDYDAAVNAIATRTPALFVPRSDNRNRDELVRAQRLVYWGAGRLMVPQLLNGASLANEIHQFAKFERRALTFDLDGAAKAAHLISDIAYRGNYTPADWRPLASTQPQ